MKEMKCSQLTLIHERHEAFNFSDRATTAPASVSLKRARVEMAERSISFSLLRWNVSSRRSSVAKPHPCHAHAFKPNE